MHTVRLIARLDIKAPNLIKGIHLEGLRVIGDPNVYARRYYEQGADELIYMDIVASLYERNSLTEIVESATRNVFVPLTVGGGMSSEYTSFRSRVWSNRYVPWRCHRSFQLASRPSSAGFSGRAIGCASDMSSTF